MFKNKQFILMVLVLLFSLVLYGCGQSDSTNGDGDNKEKEKVKVALVPNAPPFMYEENGELTGFEVEIVNAIAEMQNLEIEWKPMKFDGMIPGLEVKQLDAAIAAFFVTDERKKIIDYSDPYFVQGIVVGVPVDSDIQSFEDLKGKTLVAKSGSHGLEAAKELAHEYDAELKILQDEPTMYIELETGNADAIVHDSTVISYKIAKDGDDASLRIVGDIFDSTDTAIAFTKGSKYVEVFNEGLKELKESGKFDEIYSKYFSK